MKWYLAGPMTGIHDHNYPAFHAEAARLRAAGMEVINPAEINAVKPDTWAAAMRADIAALLTCDGIVLMPGWEHSKGATLEYKIASALGMQIDFITAAVAA